MHAEASFSCTAGSRHSLGQGALSDRLDSEMDWTFHRHGAMLKLLKEAVESPTFSAEAKQGSDSQ